MAFREVEQSSPQQALEGDASEETRLSRWMAQAQKGDADAYRKLLTELNAMLEAYAARAVRRFSRHVDVALARDIAQEALLAIHAKRHTYDPGQRLLPWVFGIARHKLIDWQRRHVLDKQRFGADVDPDTLAESPSLEPGPSAAPDLRALLEQLNPRQRQVLELTKIQGYSVAEAAHRTGLSEANVKVLTHRGIQALKKIFEARHE